VALTCYNTLTRNGLMTRDLRDLMTSEGFILHRSGKHLIWRDADGIQVVTAATPSCRRTLQNVRSTIRRARHRVA
jgi:hypothetical protein